MEAAPNPSQPIIPAAAGLPPHEILALMLQRDRFSQWLGLVIDEHAKGYCRLHYRITDSMLNGLNTVHGGILFSAADSALAFACNSHGILTVALDATISFTRPAHLGDLLTVEAKELHLGHKIGVYDIRTTNEQGELVALFKGTGYRTSKMLK
jgi:acyl-CoA thioesterase